MLPPGVDAKTFASAIAAFKDAVGSEWVFTSPEDVALYRDAYSVLWGEAEERLASAAVAPKTVEQVQKVVAAANQYKVPIYPVSTGMDLGYGGSAPNLSGSVVLDLKRMNQVVEVDDRRYFAIVEPGVTYFDLYRYFQEHGVKAWMDCPDPGWGSPMGNSLDYGSGYTYSILRDHFYAHCGMEVVLPNGELMRTGMGALPGAKTWADYHYGIGPYVDGLFGQGNFGVVTKMGFWLLPPPEHYLRGTVFVPKRADLIRLVDEINYLEYLGLIGMPMYGAPLQGVKEAHDLEYAPDWPTDAALDKIASDHHVPSWSCALQFYGPPKTVQANWEYAQERLRAAIPGATFKIDLSTDLSSSRLPLVADEVKKSPFKAQLGIPSLAVFAIGTRTVRTPSPSDGEAWFSPIVPKNGEGIFESQRVFGDALREVGKKIDIPAMFEGRGVPYGPFQLAVPWVFHTWWLISSFPISRSDQEHNKRVREVVNHLIQVGADHGYTSYRVAAAFQEQTARAFSFNNHALMRFKETLKDAIDPNGIISPGRYGLWPKHLRKT